MSWTGGESRTHRQRLTVVRKGGKIVTMPLAPRVARALDLVIGDRAGGPVFVSGLGRPMDRHAASRIVRRVARAAGLDKHITPHSLRRASSLPPWMPASLPGMCRRPPATLIRAQPCATTYDRGRQSLDGHATYIVATFVAGASR